MAMARYKNEKEICHLTDTEDKKTLDVYQVNNYCQASGVIWIFNAISNPIN